MGISQQQHPIQRGRIMLVTNFNFKYLLYKTILPFFQFYDAGNMHPIRERAKRSLQRSVDYIDNHMHKAVGFETQKDLILHATNAVTIPGTGLSF